MSRREGVTVENKVEYRAGELAEKPEEKSELVPADQPRSLVGYGDRADVKELATRLLQMLPQVKKVGFAGALALAQVAVRMGLNPLVGEIWAIPHKDGSYSLMTGIKGLRRAGHNQAAADNGFYTVRFRVAKDEELQGVTLGAGDLARACDLVVSGDRARAYREQTQSLPIFTGIGIYRHGEQTMMHPLACARKRAEADALKQAFDLPLLVDERQDAEMAQDLVDVEVRSEAAALWQAMVPGAAERVGHGQAEQLPCSGVDDVVVGVAKQSEAPAELPPAQKTFSEIVDEVYGEEAQ